MSTSSVSPSSTPSTAPTTFAPPPAVVVTPEQLLEHWQGHRRLTRRLIEVFPEEELFSLTIGGMRTFGAIALELLAIAEPTVRGIATGTWESWHTGAECSKAELLRRWDEDTAKMDALWARIPASRFQETETAFGQYEGQVHALVLYAIDNEVHHRGQGYAYLRALGVEPPPFWER